MNICSTNYTSKDFKPFDCQEKVKEFLALLNHPEVQAFLKLFVENSIITSELQILQRLSALEDSQATPQLNKQPLTEHIPIPETRTAQRACKVVEKLKDKRALGASEIVQYLRHEIEEPLRIKDGQNYRQIKKEVLQKVIELFPSLRVDKSAHGRRQVRLINAVS
jgi:hypothetical protein